MNHRLNDSHILNINRAALKLLGYETLEELTADGFDLIASSVVEEDRELLRNSIRTLKKAGDTVNVAYRVRHKNGDILHIMGNIKLYEENGELLCQRFLVDVTEQKLQEHGICKDAGYSAIAGQIEVFGKLSVLFAGMPILFAVMEYIQGFML